MHQATLICAVLLYQSMHNYSANWSEVNATVLAFQGKMLLKDYLFLIPFSYKASHKNVTAFYYIVFKNMVFTQFLHPVLVTWRLTSYPR